MYLRKVRLTHWGCHDELAIEFGEGLNVCVGPNGAGKSTLYQAIFTALTVKHNSKSVETQTFASWGTDGAGPSAVLEVVRADGAWRLTKSFLHEVACTLERDHPGGGGGDRLKFKNKQAEQALVGWLESDGAAGRLMLALWSAQNDPIQLYSPDAGPEPHARADLLEKVIARASRPDDSGPFAVVKRAVAKHCDETFTPVKKDFKTDSPIDLARQNLVEADSRLEILRAKHREMKAKIDGFGERSARHGQDCRDRDALRREREERARRAAEFREKSATLSVLQRKADDLKRRLEDHEAAHQRLVKAEADRERAEAAVLGLAPRRRDAVESLRQADAAWQVVEARVGEALGKLDALASLFERRDRLAALLDLSIKLRGDEQAARHAYEQAVADAERAAQDAETARVESARADHIRAAVDRARRRREREVAANDWRQAETLYRDAEAADLAANRDRLRNRLGRVRVALDELASLNRDGDDGPVPPDAVLAALRDDEAALRLQADQLERDAVTVRFWAEAPVQAAFVEDGSDPVAHELAAGHSFEARALANFSVAIAGVGRIEVGLGPDPAERLEALRRARHAFAHELKEWQAPSVAALDERRRRDRDRQALQARIDGQLAGETVEAMEEKMADLAARLAELGVGADDPAPAAPPSSKDLKDLQKQRDKAGHKLATAQALCPEDDGSETDADLPEAAEAEKRAVSAKKNFDGVLLRAKEAETGRVRTESDLKNAGIALDEADQKLKVEAHGSDPFHRLGEMEGEILTEQFTLAGMKARVVGEQTRASVGVVEQRLNQEKQSARDACEQARRTFEDLERKWISAETMLNSLTRRCDELRAAVPVESLKTLRETCADARAQAAIRREELPADPALDAQAFETRLAESEKLCHECETDLAKLEGELNTLGAEGLDSQLHKGEELVEDCRKRYARLFADAQSWSVLEHLLREVEANQSQIVARQIENLATGLVARLTGGNADGVTFDPKSLVPTAAGTRRNGLGETAAHFSLERFSRGTREQVALACRLQIGLLLGQETRQMLLLDDPLAHTDADRHRVALDVLEELAEKLQLIIFTCHADRYLSLWAHHPSRRIDVAPASSLTGG